MRTSFLRLWVMLCLCAGQALAHAALNLDAVGIARDVGAQSHWWLTDNTALGIKEIAGPNSAAAFSAQANATHRLRPENRLWVRIDLQRSTKAAAQWILSVPLPFIDSVTLFQPNAAGGFTAQSAGDRIAVAQWPERGRYPQFRLVLPDGAQTVYLQIEGSTPVNVPIVMTAQSEADSDMQISYLGLGVCFGVLMLMAVVCAMQGYAYKDRVYAWYGVYVLLVVLAIACYNGLAAQYLWDESPRWADASQAVMGALTSGAALFFVHRVSGAASFFSRRWSLAVLSLSAAGVLVAAVFTLVPRYVGVTVLMAYVIGTALLGLWLAMKIWQRDDHIGVWLAAAHGPLVVVALMILLRAAGWVSLLWVVQWGLVAALLVQAPLLMMALQLRSRERHDAQNREQAMFTHDPLTGLLSVHMFDDRLRQTIVRARSHREDAAIVLVQVVNYPHILRALGTKVADQSLLSAVLKLRRVVRDVDTVCRVNESTFGLILEGISARNSVTRVASRMVALGLMPVEGIVPQVTLQFHFASVVLHEYVDDPEHILEKLNALLSGMSVRTRRPIRFLELPETMAQAYASQSNSGFDASIDPLTEHSTVPPPPTPLGTPLRLATHRP